MTIIPVEYEIRSIINDLYNIVRMRADNKGLKVILDIDPSIPSVLFGDENRIKQVVSNILTNAVKYTEKGSVTLSIRKTEDSSSVESIYGEGSTFGFEIIQGVVSDEPVGEIKGRLKNPEHHRYRVKFTAEDARILVVDDNMVNLNVIKNLLKETRLQVDTAVSGEEALGLVKKNEYDVIFLDHLMPNMDGPETLEYMRKMWDNRSKNAPVISLTANALSGARDQYLKAGFRDYLSKPVDPQNLEDLLFNYISPEKIRTVKENDDRPEREVKNPLPEWLNKVSDIDAEMGLKNCSTVEIYLTALECFYEVIGENADEIEEYWQKKDWENYTIKVHALRSSAKLIGASSLAGQAEILEKAGHNSDTEVISQNTEKLLNDYRALKEELSDHYNKGLI